MRLKRSDIKKKERPPVTAAPAAAPVDYTPFFNKLEAAISDLPIKKNNFATYRFDVRRNKDGLIESVLATPQNERTP